MTAHWWLQYAMALIVVALVLVALLIATRAMSRGRVVLSAKRRLVTIVESTPLGAHSALHVVKVGGRYLLVGSSSAGACSIADLAPEEIDAWLEAQRASFAQTKRVWESLRSFPWLKR